MANKTNPYNHQVSSFNPACCLKQPTVKESTTARQVPSDALTAAIYYPSARSNASGRHAALFIYEPLSPIISCIGSIKKNKSCKTCNKKQRRRRQQQQQQQQIGFRKILIGLSNSMRATAKVRDEFVLAELDPPLPVVRRPVVKNEEVVSLWSKRRGGARLESLQLHQQQVERMLQMQRAFAGGANNALVKL